MPRVPRCAKCRKPLRKGQGVVVTLFAEAGGVSDEGYTFAPWAQIVTCLSHDPAESKAARALALAQKPRTMAE